MHIRQQEIDRALDVVRRFDLDRAADMIPAEQWPDRAEELAAELARILDGTKGRMAAPARHP